MNPRARSERNADHEALPNPASRTQLANLDRLSRLMDAAGIDLLIATTPENVLYLTSFYSLSHWLIANTECYVVIARHQLDKPLVVFPKSDSDLVAESGTHGLSLFPYGSFFIERSPGSDRLTPRDSALAHIIEIDGFETPGAALLAALRSLRCSAEQIALDPGRLSGKAREVVVRFGDSRRSRISEDGGKILSDARMVKTPEEILRLSYAATVTEDAICAVLDNVTIGNSEKDAKRIFQEHLVRHDVEPRLSVIAFGSHSAYPNGQPGEYKLEEGDIIRFDVGGVFNNYWSDLSRVAIVGEPTKKMAAVYRALRVGQEECLSAARPGRTASEVFEVTMEAVREAGIPDYRRQHVGHGIGLNIYDPPVLKSGNATVLEPGMLCCIETPYYEAGFGGLQVEDLIEITAAGPRFITQSSREFRQIGN